MQKQHLGSSSAGEQRAQAAGAAAHSFRTELTDQEAQPATVLTTRNNNVKANQQRV